MPETKSSPKTDGRPKRKNRNRKSGYVHRNNALHVTIYHPQGENVPGPIFDEIEKAILDIALKNNLLIGRATT